MPLTQRYPQFISHLNTLHYYTGTQNVAQRCNGKLTIQFIEAFVVHAEICIQVSIVHSCTHLKLIVLFSLPLILLFQTITFYSEIILSLNI